MKIIKKIFAFVFYVYTPSKIRGEFYYDPIGAIVVFILPFYIAPAVFILAKLWHNYILPFMIPYLPN